uniref:Phosphotransferase n=1 Tax=Callorhinchus milii TaxID=7868 RepID=A0A4W3GIV7_CALMI
MSHSPSHKHRRTSETLTHSLTHTFNHRCRWTHSPTHINKILYRFKLSQEQLNDMKQRMRKEMEMGLKAETHDMSSIAMLPSFIRTLPNGSEQGNFLALHLGDLNVRILLMHIPSQDENEIEVVNTNYSLPQEMFHLFDHVVDCINDFLQKNNIMGSLPVGFTFSFPCKQTKLDEGFLIKWTKGFKTTGCEGKDVVDLLRKAIARKNQKMDPVWNVEFEEQLKVEQNTKDLR